MKSLLRSNASLVWVGLIVLTVVSWALGRDHGLSGHHKAASLVILAVAVFKVRLVGLYFMELKWAPMALRGLFEGYCVVLLALLNCLFILG
jgi:caa(3)-type oxidase subunit IV